MSIPQKPRTHAPASSAGVGSFSGVGPGRPGFFAALPLTIALALASSACSDDGDRIDQNYGKDVGDGYHLPSDASADAPAVDAGAATDPDAAAGDAGVVAPDAPQVEPSDATADGADEATPG
jgi:hypothetical protein